MVTEIPWGDGTSDKIYLTYSASEGDQTILVSSDANTNLNAARSKVLTVSTGAISRTLVVSQSKPTSYTNVDYVENRGGAYINTNVRLTTRNFRIEYKGWCQWGWATQGQVSQQWLGYIDAAFYRGTFGTRTIITGFGDEECVFNSQAGLYVNGNLIESFSIGKLNTYQQQPLYLFADYDFAGSNVENISPGRIYSFKIYDDDVLVADYKPVLSNDGVYGLYDNVSNTFVSSSNNTPLCGPSVLPVGYQKVEYIQNTSTSYINTGFTNTINTIYKIDFQCTTYNDDRKIIGQGFKFGFAHVSGRWRIVDSAWYRTNVATDGNRHIAWTRGSSGEYYIDSRLLTTRPAYKTAGTYPMLIFAVSQQNSALPDGNRALMKCYRCQIIDNGIIVRDYIPVKRLSDDVYGLYDLINSSFNASDDNASFTGATE